MRYPQIFLIFSIFVFTFSSSYAYRIKDVKKHDGYIESIINCENGKRTFVHKTPKGYYASTYKRLDTFEEAVKESCRDGNNTEPIEKKIFRLKHNAKVCKSIESIERLLSSQKAYHFSVSRECFTAMDVDKVEVFNKYTNGNLIDEYYKVMYDDEIHYIRSNDMFVENNLVPKNKRLIKNKKVTKKVKKKNIQKKKKRKITKNKNKKTQKKKVRKKKVTKRVQKRKKHLKVYSCRAKSKSAIGWSNGSTLAKAKKSAIFQCSIRSKSSDTCKIIKCTKKR